MTTEEHSEEAIREAVVGAVERLEGPDRQRLARIEQRLLAGARRRRRAPRWWVLVGLGLAAGAAAAYWGLYGSDPGAGTRAPVPGAEETGAPSTPGPGADESAGSREPRDAGGAEKKADPIIYMGD